MTSFQTDSCDLCGGQTAVTLLQSRRSMTSDARVTNVPLHKVACERCKLARNGSAATAEELSEYYRREYSLNDRVAAQEHTFVVDGIPTPRSQFIHDQIVSLLGGALDPTLRLLEVGCGAGELLSKFAVSEKRGIELSGRAVEQAQAAGLAVQQGGYDAVSGEFDLIVAFGVIEHVPSPSHFLEALRRSLAPNGRLVLGQPIQDAVSYDIFFNDHLHHFWVDHLRLYFQKSGLAEQASRVGIGPLPNFSLHVLTRSEPAKPSFETSVEWDLRVFQQQFAALEEFVARRPGESPLYAFGASEVLSLFDANTSLRRHIAGVIDDFNPAAGKLDEVEHERPGFVLTLNPAYQEKVAARIRQRHPAAVIYSPQAMQELVP